jgi:hypothetical protein
VEEVDKRRSQKVRCRATKEYVRDQGEVTTRKLFIRHNKT